MVRVVPTRPTPVVSRILPKVAPYVLGAVLLISLAFALFTSQSHRQDGFNPDSTDPPSAAGSGAEEQPVVSSPSASRSSPSVTLRWEDVVSRCHYLRESETTGQLEQDCVSALDQWFLDKPLTASILPVSRPVRWKDVFDEVQLKIEAVRTALDDQRCVVTAGVIRYDLAEYCHARSMVELQVVMDVCAHVESDGSYTVVVSPDWSSEQNGVDHYLSRVWPGHHQSLLQDIDSSEDQASYFRGTQLVEQARYRTAWILRRCQLLVSELPNRGAANSTILPPLLAIAARHGDEFGLAAYPVRGLKPNPATDSPHLERLLETNPLQAFIHYASWYPAWVHHLWTEATGHESAMLGQSLLELAGVDPREDYTPQEVHAKLQRHTQSARLTYVLATELLAKETDIQIDPQALERLLSSGDSALLSVNDYNLAKYKAEELVAQYAHRR